MVVHLFLNNNKALDFLPINSIKNGGITVEAAFFTEKNRFIEYVRTNIKDGKERELLIKEFVPLMMAYSNGMGRFGQGAAVAWSGHGEFAQFPDTWIHDQIVKEKIKQGMDPDKADTIATLELMKPQLLAAGIKGAAKSFKGKFSIEQRIPGKKTNEFIFENASYHSTKGNNVKSASPTFGQDVLNESIQVKSTSPRRVGVDKLTGEYVVFDRTINNTYHGHVRTWNELHTDMKNSLINSGLVKPNGKIK